MGRMGCVRLTEVVGPRLDRTAEAGAIRGAERVAKDLKARALVEAEHTLHQMGERVMQKVGGHLADAETALSRGADRAIACRVIQVRRLRRQLRRELGNVACVRAREP